MSWTTRSQAKKNEIGEGRNLLSWKETRRKARSNDLLPCCLQGMQRCHLSSMLEGCSATCSAIRRHWDGRAAPISILPRASSAVGEN